MGTGDAVAAADDGTGRGGGAGDGGDGAECGGGGGVRGVFAWDGVAAVYGEPL